MSYDGMYDETQQAIMSLHGAGDTLQEIEAHLAALVRLKAGLEAMPLEELYPAGRLPKGKTHAQSVRDGARTGAAPAEPPQAGDPRLPGETLWDAAKRAEGEKDAERAASKARKLKALIKERLGLDASVDIDDNEEPLAMIDGVEFRLQYGDLQAYFRCRHDTRILLSQDVASLAALGKEMRLANPTDWDRCTLCHEDYVAQLEAQAKARGEEYIPF